MRRSQALVLLAAALVTTRVALTQDPDDEPSRQGQAPTSLFWHEDVGGPSALDGKSFTPASLGLGTKSVGAEELAVAFLESKSALVKSAPQSEWQVSKVVEADDADHVFVKQSYKGVPVFGGEAMVRVKDGKVVGGAGDFLDSFGVSTEPRLDAGEAFEEAKGALENLNEPRVLHDELVIFNPAIVGLPDGANHLAHKLVIEDQDGLDSRTALVDAHTGEVLAAYSNIQDARNRAIRDFAETEQDPNKDCQAEGATASDGVHADCKNAFAIAGEVYDYYQKTHGRDGYDGGGAPMKTFVRYGKMDNAFWTGEHKLTVFGPGYVTRDIVAHEWTHAVVEYTAGLVYFAQSGALNESMADVFGAMIDRDDWEMGEDSKLKAIRDLSNPNRFKQPAKGTDPLVWCRPEDNMGVHHNSGIPNHAAYLMADGGTKDGVTIKPIGREATEKIFFRALSAYMTPVTNFNDAYYMLLASATDLYGAGSPQVATAKAALDAVEMNKPICISARFPVPSPSPAASPTPAPSAKPGFVDEEEEFAPKPMDEEEEDPPPSF